MKCAVHAEVDASGFCRNCGKALCGECARDVRGILYCEACLADIVAKPQPAPGGSGSPALAAILGVIPGLGAVYNAEYIKALMHVLIFGALISLVDRAEAFIPLMIAFIVYMPFEAYRTAKAKQMGQPSTMPLSDLSKAQPIGSWLLIVLGVLLLLENFDWISLRQLDDYLWPLLLIGAGVWLLRRRTMAAGSAGGTSAGGGQ